MKTSMTRRLLGGVLVVLLLTVAGCSSPSKTATPAPTATTATPAPTATTATTAPTATTATTAPTATTAWRDVSGQRQQLSTRQSVPVSVVKKPADIIRESIPATALIEGKTSKGTESLGTGFVIDPSGVIVTNMHVVRGLTSARVRLPSGDSFDRVIVRAYDEAKDVAIIQVPAFRLPTVLLGNSDSVQQGDTVILLGSPLGLTGTATTGIVSAIRQMDGFRLFQTDAAANPGNSGGPMLNDRGEVVGILTSGIKSAENLNFVVPINYARGLATVNEGLPLEQFARMFPEPSTASSSPNAGAEPPSPIGGERTRVGAVNTMVPIPEVNVSPIGGERTRVGATVHAEFEPSLSVDLILDIGSQGDLVARKLAAIRDGVFPKFNMWRGKGSLQEVVWNGCLASGSYTLGVVSIHRFNMQERFYVCLPPNNVKKLDGNYEVIGRISDPRSFGGATLGHKLMRLDIRP